MARVFTEDRIAALDGCRIFVLCADPVSAFDLAEHLERAGAEAVTVFNLHHLACGLQNGYPDGAVGELCDQNQWLSAAIALLHELAVPQVLGTTERQRQLLRAKMPNAVFLPAPLNPADAALSLSVVLRPNWPRLLRPNWSDPTHRGSALPAAALSLEASRQPAGRR